MTLLYLFGAISTKGEANCLQQRFAIAWVSLKNLVGAIAWFPLRIGGDRLGFPQELWAIPTERFAIAFSRHP
ncbi:hypothetical protein [Dolichospermum sp. LEGE 00246]|uniref:hypothetical protein n=1 Tax=Dolichospermum sp. LEGE 00246 TaxID=1828605 RepID=UPI00187F500D|nr:hypothetical protein [Dolichospermum sp. LEGE 00246]MBE9257509.1 hypothetical protein [Dolichospermum sp. LEGE 00246]